MKKIKNFCKAGLNKGKIYLSCKGVEKSGLRKLMMVELEEQDLLVIIQGNWPFSLRQHANTWNGAVYGMIRN